MREDRFNVGAAANPLEPRVWASLTIVAFVLVGGALLLWPSREDPEPAVHGEQLRVALHDLERATRERARLAEDVEALRVRLELLEWGVGASAGETSRKAAPPEAAMANEPQGERPRGAQRPAFDEERLLEAGIGEREAGRLRALWSDIELAKLRVIDQAEREGWSRRRRYDELQALQESVRSSLDEDSYDQYLYAAGRPNRVVVRDVLDRSPAAMAGLRPGDIVLSYDGSRIFGREELNQAISFREEEEQVQIEVLREGRVQRVSVPGGPIGALMTAQLHEPR
jgi:hypothetical protein